MYNLNTPFTQKNAAYLGAAALRIALIQMHAPLIAFVWVALAELVVSAIGLLIAYKITGQSILRWRVNLGEIKIILRDSWPLLFSGLMIMIYMRADQIMIGQMIGNTEVGIYATAVRFAEMWNFIPMAVASSTLPSIVSVAHDEKTMYVRLQKLYNMTALLTYTIAIILTLVAYPLVHILLGSAYVRAIPMLIVLAWSGVFTGLGVARSSFLTAMNWPKVHLLTVFLGCIVNLTLNFLLIPRFGGLGAAIASLAAYWFATHGSCFFYRPLLKSGIMLTRAMIYPKV